MSPLSLRFLLPFSLAISAATSLLAQSAGPTTEQLRSWVTVRQQRVDLLREEIKQADAHIESRLDLMIDTLAAMTDSKDSRTKVARMKEDTMKGLAKAIQNYDQKRATFRQELRNPQTQLSEAEKKKVLSAFDTRIEKRTRQILALQQSMPEHRDYERYKATGGGWHGTEYQQDKDFEQNRRMTTHSNTQRDAIARQLDASIARLDRLGRDLRTQLAATNSPAQQKDRLAEIAKNDALIAERRRQKLDLLKPSDKAAREVSLKEAVDIDQAMKKGIEALRRDVTTFFGRYHAFVGEVTALRATEATLAARKAN